RFAKEAEAGHLRKRTDVERTEHNGPGRNLEAVHVSGARIRTPESEAIRIEGEGEPVVLPRGIVCLNYRSTGIESLDVKPVRHEKAAAAVTRREKAQGVGVA